MHDRLVVISGGTRGLGAAVVSQCLHAGYKVATFSRGPSPFVEEQRALDPDERRFRWNRSTPPTRRQYAPS